MYRDACVGVPRFLKTRLASTSPAIVGLAVLNLTLFFILISSPPTYLPPSLRPTVLSQHFPNFADPAPGPASCELCVLDPYDPLCQYGLDNVRLSRSYEGSGYRVRRFLEKAITGAEVKVGVIGASVSMGHGVVHLGLPVWQTVFLRDFQTMFPNATLHEGLAGGADSGCRSQAAAPSELADTTLQVTSMRTATALCYPKIWIFTLSR